MTGAEVKQIRIALGDALGRRISQSDLGRALRLAPASGADTVRSWEDGKRAVTGPAAVALRLLGYGAGVGDLPDQSFERDTSGEFRAVMLGIAESMLGVEQQVPGNG
jgi:hypothetical protein